MVKVSMTVVEQEIAAVKPCVLCDNMIPEHGERYCCDCKSYVEDLEAGMFDDCDDWGDL